MAGKIQWDEAAGPARNARRKLPGLVREYFAEGRALAAGKASAAAFHRFRLRTKRLRYTLELFRPCYGPGLDRRLQALHQVQQLLGELNDCAAARRIVDGLLPPRAPQRLRLHRMLEARARQKMAGFRAYWTGHLDAAGQEHAWCGYLARPRPARVRRSRAPSGAMLR
jgi:CHAD domain-containing protein